MDFFTLRDIQHCPSRQEEGAMNHLLRVLSSAEQVPAIGEGDLMAFENPIPFIDQNPFDPIFSEYILDCSMGDPYQPTPIGPNGLEKVVPEVPLTSFFRGDEVRSNGHVPAHGDPTPEEIRSLPINQAATVGTISANATRKSRKFQVGRWNERFQDLLDFHEQHGNVLVPHHYPTKPKLAQWVKRYVIDFRCCVCFNLLFCPLLQESHHRYCFRVSDRCAVAVAVNVVDAFAAGCSGNDTSTASNISDTIQP
jgi:hypothetical protein